MATSPVVVFQSLGKQPPAADVIDKVKRQEGFLHARFGLKMEDEETGVFVTEWTSPDAALSYRSSQLATSLGSGEHTLTFTASGWSAVLEAPCTEVFTAFGAEEGFEANVGSFVNSIEADVPEGSRGAAFGGSLGGEEKVVRMVIGWTSREAHLEAKGKPGAIQDNIHLLRTLRKSVDLFHVQLSEL